MVDAPVPLDWRSTNDDFGVAVTAAIQSPDVDAIVVVHAPPIAAAHPPAAAIDAAAAGSTTPVVAVMLGRHDGPIREGSDVPSFSFPEPAAAVLGRMYAYRRWLDTEAETAVVESMEGLDRDTASAILAAAVDRGEAAATSSDAMAVLAAYGVSAPPTILTVDADVDGVVDGGNDRRLPGRAEVAPPPFGAFRSGRSGAGPARRRWGPRRADSDAHQPGRRRWVDLGAAHGATGCRRAHPLHDRWPTGPGGDDRPGRRAGRRDRRRVEPPGAGLARRCRQPDRLRRGPARHWMRPASTPMPLIDTIVRIGRLVADHLADRRAGHQPGRRRSRRVPRGGRAHRPGTPAIASTHRCAA